MAAANLARRWSYGLCGWGACSGERIDRTAMFCAEHSLFAIAVGWPSELMTYRGSDNFRAALDWSINWDNAHGVEKDIS